MDSNSFYYFLAPSGRAYSGAEPVIPLPNVGEGGPVYPGDMDPGFNDPGQIPVIPLPNPGEGGPVYPGNDGGEPVIPLPNPGEGGPVYPGNNWGCSNGICGGVTILPGIIGTVWPSASRTRFLNAAYGYQAFRVFVGNTRAANVLNYASVTSYGRVAAGYQTVTVTGMDGYIYIQKTMPFQANAVTTIAIINTAGGLDLLQITDSCCPPTNGYSSFRVGSLDIETLDSAWLGVYPPHETFGSLYLNVVSNAIYTVYLLQSGTGHNNIQNLILMDR